MTDESNSSDIDAAFGGSPTGGSVTLKVNKNRLIAAGVAVVIVVAGFFGWKAVFGGSDFAGMLNKASQQIHAGSYAPAEALLQQVIAQNTTNEKNYNAIAYYDLGVSAQKQGQLAVAISYYSRCLTLAPEYRNAWYNKAVAEMTTNKTQALADFNHILTKYPNDSSSLYNSGLLLYRAGNTIDGVSRIKRGIALNQALANRLPADISLS